MGLDMYLTAKRYLGNWDHQRSAEEQPEKEAHKKVLAAIGLEGFRCEGAPSLQVEVTVAYWRKANQIHHWFVQNVCEGKDEAGDHYVERVKLEALVALCNRVLESVETVEGDISMGTTYHGDGRIEEHTKRGPVVAQKNIAAELLPTQAGFFFGSTDYDEYYLADLKDTIAQLRAVLDNKALDRCEFYYHASW
jgi:hypothetical protein